MQLTLIRVDDQITHLALVGSLNVAGLHAVDVKFHGYTAARRKPTLVDLSQLDFISSLGMGMFISCGQSLGRHGVKMVLLNPQPLIEEAMDAVGLGRVIPIAHSQDEAMRILFPTDNNA
jgi:anti-anti-sigma factor